MNYTVLTQCDENDDTVKTALFCSVFILFISQNITAIVMLNHCIVVGVSSWLGTDNDTELNRVFYMVI